MEGSWGKMAGRIELPLPVAGLAELFRDEGFQVELIESQHHPEGCYFRAIVGGARYVVERFDNREFYLDSDADSFRLLFGVTSRLSAALTARGIRHVLQVYDSGADVTYTLQHRWPKAGSRADPGASADGRA